MAFNDVVDQIRKTLGVSDPALDTSTGTTTRKIIEAVAESIAEASVDKYLISYQYDIDSKTDQDLDAFTQLFGITRYGAKRSTGTVIFLRDPNQANQPVVIPTNTQVGTSTTPQVIATTITAAYMDIGTSSVTVPVQAVDGGAGGNVGTGTLTVILSPLSGVSTVSNIKPMTGGASQETDDELRQRWKATVFRNLAGTEPMYLGIALNDGLLNDPGCTQANVVGATKTSREQVQVEGGSAVSQTQDVLFAYPNSVTAGTDIDSGDVLLLNHDYTFSTSGQPTINDAGGLSNGSLYDLEYEYVPTSSRNDPTHQITNRVDVWVNGVRPVEAQQSVLFQSTKVFSTAPLDPYYLGSFVRPDGTNPTSGDTFIPLAFGPIVTLPPVLTVGSQTFYQATADNPLGTTDSSGAVYAYSIVHADGPFGWSPASLFGIEWDKNNLPTATGSAAVFVVGDVGDESSTDTGGYTYNEVPLSIQNSIESWRLLGTDVLVHQAKEQALRLNLVLMVNPQQSVGVTTAAVATAVESYLAAMPFDSTVQVNEVLRFVLDVPGVVNGRFKTAFDYGGAWSYANRNQYGTGIQRVIDGVVQQTYVDTQGNPLDVEFGDDELPTFDSLYGDSANPGQPSVRAQNTFWQALG